MRNNVVTFYGNGRTLSQIDLLATILIVDHPLIKGHTY